MRHSVTSSAPEMSAHTNSALTNFLLLATLLLLAAAPLQAQVYRGGQHTRSLVTQSIDESKMVSLAGNTRFEATSLNDRGEVAETLRFENLQLLLQRPPEVEQQLEKLIAGQQRKGSPVYHHWLTAQEFGQRFGASRQDVEKLTSWLESHGFQVNAVFPGGTVITFSGNAGQIKEAFHTEIHNLDVDGKQHIANMSDPRIPAALANVVKGVYSLHDFMPHSMIKKHSNLNIVLGGTTYYALAPPDMATIYNLNPAFAAGYTGAGQTIVVIEDTNILNASDVATFRSAFGLSGYAGTFTQVNPTGGNTCTNPGVNGDEDEASLDAEWAGASAPDADIVLASCKDTTAFGGLLALQNLINGVSPPQIVSISYGECETENGAAANASYNSTYQQAASEGVSVFVSSGDEGAASCDADRSVATHGINVSGFTSTPYNVSVGGTDFGDTYASLTGGPPVSTYWSATESATFGSALSYIPEIPWNDSCAGELLYSLEGFTQSYGPTGFCNDTTIPGTSFRSTASGSGGPSTCATGTASISGVTSGTCAGYAKPSWQSGLVGNPSDGVRDIPDISLFAANGLWNHFLVYCLTDTAEGGAAACDYTNPSDVNDLAAGGTSFSSPIMAGIQALVNQSVGSSQGNPDNRYYELAGLEYGATGDSACNSSLGTGANSSCVFYDVTLGDMDVNCDEDTTRRPSAVVGTFNCYGTVSSGTTVVDQGALSVSNSVYQPAYGTTAGWDFATGIGTVNAYNLIQNWVKVQTTTTVGSSQNPSVYGHLVTFTATITPAIGSTETGTVTWSANTGCGSTPVTPGSPGTATCNTTTLPPGSDTITASYSGDSNYSGSTGTLTPNQQVNQPASITSPNFAVFTIGVAGSFTVTTVGVPTPSITEAGPLPTGLSFHDNGDGTGTLHGTPLVFVGGDFGITFTATNGIGSPGTQAFTIVLQQAPAITSANTATFTIGTANSFTVTTAGFPAPSIHESGALPAGVTFVDNHNGTGTLSGMPSVGGTFPLVLTATNVVTTATQNFTLNVAGVSISPSNLNFGTAILNSSTTLSVTLTNMTKSPVTINSVSITPGTANAAAYKAVSHCTAALKTGKSCTIAVTFLANALGLQTATLNVLDSTLASPQEVGLSAYVVDPVAQFSPTKLAFGTEAVNSSTTLPVTLTNTGQTDLNIGTISIVGANSGEFTEVNNCPAVLSATVSCTISVTFAPTVKGARTGTLTVSDNVAGGQSTVAITGTGH